MCLVLDFQNVQKPLKSQFDKITFLKELLDWQVAELANYCSTQWLLSRVGLFKLERVEPSLSQANFLYISKVKETFCFTKLLTRRQRNFAPTNNGLTHCHQKDSLIIGSNYMLCMGYLLQNYNWANVQ